ncbi:MAG TPA: metallophosphoesterase [Planctomycetaceae bacterium]|nr:metallophosphoesterase [Planctomycetaceae bacterium]
MNAVHGPVTVAVPGDLHLTTRDQPNYGAAVHAIDEINTLLRPDFVQFIGDNVQDADEEQFRLFRELTGKLTCRHFALVGDHDICGDARAPLFREYLGSPSGSFTHKGIRFIRLNTLEIPQLGFSDEQLRWLGAELEEARQQQERVVLFQHHYPYKVCEEFTGPGIGRWRELVDEHRPTAIICGHTHYAQTANNGRNIAVATRSIGDPEGGPPGYLVVHLEDDDLALAYRTIEDSGPLLLITHPRDLLLATGPEHIVSEDDEIRVRIWSNEPIAMVTASLDEGPAFALDRAAAGEWRGFLDATRMAKGEHTLCVEALTTDEVSQMHRVDLARAARDQQPPAGLSGARTRQTLAFFFDPTKRFTAVPSASPTVRTTAFC